MLSYEVTMVPYQSPPLQDLPPIYSLTPYPQPPKSVTLRWPLSSPFPCAQIVFKQSEYQSLAVGLLQTRAEMHRRVYTHQ